MLNKRVNFIGESVVDGETIANFAGVLDLDNLELTMNGRFINKDACKLHRDIVRADQHEFEDYAYKIQDMLQDIDNYDIDERSEYEDIAE